MTTAADVKRLRTQTGQVATLTRRALDAYWATLDLSDPAAARDALLDFVPTLTARYGDVAATVAADWYTDVRGKQVRGRYRPALADSPADVAVAESVRYHAGHLFDGTAPMALAGIGAAAVRYVANTARDTIAVNVRRDPSKPRWARVPSGGRTCAWCTLLASRGFVYLSEETADGGGYHDDCTCTAVADWSDDPRIDGYDPAGMYALYAEARDSDIGGNDDRSIAAAMRRLHPDLFTDGVHTHA